MKDKLPQVGTTIFTVMSALATEHGAINLAQGFPSFNPDSLLRELVNKHMNIGANQYAPMAGLPGLQNMIAELVEKCYGRKLDPGAEITITAGATEAIFSAVTAFVHPGDEVIIIEPAYDSYRPAIALCGATTVAYAMKSPDFKVDWEELESLVTPKTSVLIFNTPHNPTATTLTEADLEALCGIVERHDIILISDEVYEFMTFDGTRHESALRQERLWGKVLTSHSFGKTFHNTGWRLGYLVGAAPLMERFRKVHQYVTFSCNTPMQAALAEYMDNPNTYLSIAPFYAKKRDYFLKILEGTKFRPLPCSGSFFQLADYSAISDLDDMAFCRWLVKEHKVAAIPLSPFYGNPSRAQAKLVRFCFAKDDAILARAGEMLARV